MHTNDITQSPGSFVRYAAMVKRLSAGYTRSLVERLAARRPAP